MRAERDEHVEMLRHAADLLVQRLEHHPDRRRAGAVGNDQQHALATVSLGGARLENRVGNVSFVESAGKG